MSQDRRRPAQPQPIIVASERMMPRLSTAAEVKPASTADTARMAAEVVERLRRGGFDCEVLDTLPDATPRRLH
jgi:hypothetical protein